MKQLRLSLIALITGSLSGAAVAMVIGLIGWISQQLWGDPVLEGLDQTLPLAWTLPVCGGFGLVLALLHRRGPSTLLPELGETLQDLRHPETAPKRDNVRAIIGAALALIGGGSIGPEALMSRLAALISQRIWRGRDHALREATLAGSLGLFGAPLLGGAVVSAESSTSPRNDVVKRWVPGILGGIAGFAAFHGIGAATGGSLQRLPYVWPTSISEDIGTLSAGLIGGGIGLGLGWLLQHWRHWLDKQQLLARWAWWPLLTGLLIGACMHWLPLVPLRRGRADAPTVGTERQPPGLAAVALRLGEAADAGTLLGHWLARRHFLPCVSDRLRHRHGIASTHPGSGESRQLVRGHHRSDVSLSAARAPGGAGARPCTTAGSWGRRPAGGPSYCTLVPVGAGGG